MPSKQLKVPAPVSTFKPEYSASGSMTFSLVTTRFFQYVHFGCTVQFSLRADGTVGGTPGDTLYFTLPVSASQESIAYAYPALSVWVIDNGNTIAGTAILDAGYNGKVAVKRYDGANFTAGTVSLAVSGMYWCDTEGSIVRSQLEEDVRQLEIRLGKLERAL